MHMQLRHDIAERSHVQLLDRSAHVLAQPAHHLAGGNDFGHQPLPISSVEIL
jgi:hypothetical protein